MMSKQVTAYSVTPTIVWLRSTGRLPSGLPMTKAVPTNPKIAAASAGPHPPIQTAMAIAPISVAYGTSDPSHGISNQRSAIAAVAIAIAPAYLIALDITRSVAKIRRFGKRCRAPL
jgi:hypothetical protein